MRAVRGGERAPSGAWEVVPDTTGGFIRRQLTGAALVLLRVAKASPEIVPDAACAVDA